ncbi:MAG: DUF6502 family protein [Steroidobacteraceae bacterium]
MHKIRVTCASSLKAKTLRSRREITVDDVIKDLLDLFDHLGLDAGRLAARVVDLDPATMPSRKLYPYASAIGELLTEWHENPKYLDTLGSPMPIRMRGSRRSFRQLADKTVPKMDPKNLLSELTRIGAVSIDKAGYIRVNMRSLSVYQDKHLAIQHTLMSLDSFIRTLRHNLNSAVSNSAQLFHRVAWNGDLDVREIPMLKIRVKRRGQSFLESCDNWMTRRTKSSTDNLRRKGKRAQVFIGVYLAVDGS